MRTLPGSVRRVISILRIQTWPSSIKNTDEIAETRDKFSHFVITERGRFDHSFFSFCPSSVPYWSDLSVSPSTG